MLQEKPRRNEAKPKPQTRESSVESPKGGKYDRVNLERKRDDAVAEALAKLEATSPVPPVVPVGNNPRLKGQRQTMETMATSTTPSFGHLHHHNGKPVAGPHVIPRVLSAEEALYAAVGGEMPTPRHRHVISGVFNANLIPIGEATERESSVVRSAYVETVEDVGAEPKQADDQEEAAALGLVNGHSQAKPATPDASIHALSEWLKQVHEAAATSPELTRQLSISNQSTGVISHLEEAIEELRSASESAARTSVALTTSTQVNEMVSKSSFHDETLCQLLDAARINLIGDEAKRALMRAARARVLELRDLKQQGEVNCENS